MGSAICAKTVKRPEILRFVMTENVVVPVIREDAEVACVGGIPSSVQSAHLELPPAKDKTKGPFVGTVPRITFDAYVVHCACPKSSLLHGGRGPLLLRSVATLKAREQRL
jgi:hypothetical protein